MGKFRIKRLFGAFSGLGKTIYIFALGIATVLYVYLLIEGLVSTFQTNDEFSGRLNNSISESFTQKVQRDVEGLSKDLSDNIISEFNQLCGNKDGSGEEPIELEGLIELEAGSYDCDSLLIAGVTYYDFSRLKVYSYRTLRNYFYKEEITYTPRLYFNNGQLVGFATKEARFDVGVIIGPPRVIGQSFDVALASSIAVFLLFLLMVYILMLSNGKQDDTGLWEKNVKATPKNLIDSLTWKKAYLRREVLRYEKEAFRLLFVGITIAFAGVAVFAIYSADDQVQSAGELDAQGSPLLQSMESRRDQLLSRTDRIESQTARLRELQRLVQALSGTKPSDPDDQSVEQHSWRNEVQVTQNLILDKLKELDTVDEIAEYIKTLPDGVVESDRRLSLALQVRFPDVFLVFEDDLQQETQYESDAGTEAGKQWFEEINVGQIVRTFGTLLFIQAIAWFLLQQYRQTVRDAQKARDSLMRITALEAIEQMGSEERLGDQSKELDRVMILNLLQSQETIVLKKDETTEQIELSKPDSKNPIFELMNSFLKTQNGDGSA